VPGEDRRKGVDGVLDALVGREQTEREKDRLPLHAEPVLVEVRVDEHHVRNAVRDERDLRLGHPVDLAQEHARLPAHDDEPVGELGELLHHLPLLRVGTGEHGVERRHHRHAQLVQQSEDVSARRPAEDTVLVLQADEVDAVAVEEVGGATVRGQLLLGQLEPHALGVGVPGLPVVHRNGDDTRAGTPGGERLAEIGREGRDPALPREVVPDDGNPPERTQQARYIHVDLCGGEARRADDGFRRRGRQGIPSRGRASGPALGASSPGDAQRSVTNLCDAIGLDADAPRARADVARTVNRGGGVPSRTLFHVPQPGHRVNTSCAPQSTQNVDCRRRAEECCASSQCVTTIRGFTTPAHCGQCLTGASLRR